MNYVSNNKTDPKGSFTNPTYKLMKNAITTMHLWSILLYTM